MGNFWEVLEGIIGKILSILGSGLMNACSTDSYYQNLHAKEVAIATSRYAV